MLDKQQHSIIARPKPTYIQVHVEGQMPKYRKPKDIINITLTINKPKAKKIATLVLMDVLDYIVCDAKEIFDFYNMRQERTIIDEITYDEDYLIRYFL